MSHFNEEDHKARYGMSSALANLGFCAMLVYGEYSELDEKAGLCPLFTNLHYGAAKEMMELSE